MPKIVPESHIDPWYWCAIYSDGTSLEELEDDGTLHRFLEIDQERLVGFILRPLREDLPQFAVQLGEGRRLIFYRLRKLIGALSPETLDIVSQGRGPSYQVFGFQRTENETNFKSLTYVDESGASFVTDSENAL
jgi:hypothetical protein